MKKSRFPTVPTTLSIVSVVLLTYLGYWARSTYSSGLTGGSEFYQDILTFAAVSAGISVIIIFLAVKIMNYYRELQNNRMSRILDVLTKYHVNQELKSRVTRIFLG